MKNGNIEFILRVDGADSKLLIAPPYVAALGNPLARVTLKGKTYKPKITVDLQPADANMGVGPVVIYVDPVPVLELEAE